MSSFLEACFGLGWMSGGADSGERLRLAGCPRRPAEDSGGTGGTPTPARETQALPEPKDRMRVVWLFVQCLGACPEDRYSELVEGNVLSFLGNDGALSSYGSAMAESKKSRGILTTSRPAR